MRPMAPPAVRASAPARSRPWPRSSILSIAGSAFWPMSCRATAVSRSASLAASASACILIPTLRSPVMLIVYVFALMALGLLLGFTVHGAFLALFALGFAAFALMCVAWLWLVATRRTGFLGRRL